MPARLFLATLRGQCKRIWAGSSLNHVGAGAELIKGVASGGDTYICHAVAKMAKSTLIRLQDHGMATTLVTTATQRPRHVLCIRKSSEKAACLPSIHPSIHPPTNLSVRTNALLLGSCTPRKRKIQHTKPSSSSSITRSTNPLRSSHPSHRPCRSAVRHRRSQRRPSPVPSAASSDDRCSA